MKAIKRLNPRRVQYVLIEVFGVANRTEIRTGNKRILVDQHIDALDKDWFNWMNGMLVQDAFPFLSPDEREFLMTGITADEWNELFKRKEDN